jgi:hypothetical protein
MRWLSRPIAGSWRSAEFQNAIEKDSYWTLRNTCADCGTKRTLRFSLADIPKAPEE